MIERSGEDLRKACGRRALHRDKRVQAVLWDVDGTLVSTKDLYLECYRRALEPYVGKRLSDEELLGARPHSELQVLKSRSGEAYEACMAAFARHYAELHATHFGGIYAGVTDVLHELRARGIRTGIVTGKSRSSWEITLAQIELGEFDVVVVDDDVANPKPDPEGLLAALRALDVKPEDALYVGDSPDDMAAAHAAGMHPAAALWSKNAVWRDRFLDRIASLTNVILLDEPGDLLKRISV
jgi:pyrophosphatase PpaX